MEMMICKRFYALMVYLLLLQATGAQAIVQGSKHDLSNGSNQICGYCHTPHNASQQAGLSEAPLWNRKITDLNAFTPYSSPSMTQICPTTPSGISLACLSCHDGTQAQSGMGPTGPSPYTGPYPNYGANGNSAVFGGDQHLPLNNGIGGGGNTWADTNCSKCHSGTLPPGYIYSIALSAMAGPDLSNDHPISMPYPTANINFVTPPDPDKGWGDVKLFNGRVECPSCHNPHEPGTPGAGTTPFLRMSNSGSNMCLRCHNK